MKGVRVSGLVALLTATLLLLTSTPATATDVRIRHTLFGMHDASGLSADTLRPGSVRFWDTGTEWQQIETARGHYDWSHLDELVRDAHRHHQHVTMVVAMTPSFYAARPTDPPRRIGRYKAFVHALMKRYRSFHGYRGIDAYQAWNEGNISTFWTGTPARLATLTRAMDQVRDNVDPHAQVVAPAMVTRLRYEMKGLSAFYRQRVHGVPVWRFVDAVSLNLYPEPRYRRRPGTPEDSMRLLAQARHRLHRAGVPRSMAIWNTEVNYGMGRGTPAKRISGSRQAAYVVRTYLLNAAAGVKRVDWYRYDLGRLAGGGTLGNTLLSEPVHPHRVTVAGHAFRRVQRWMHGRLVGTAGHRPCRRDPRGTYTCVVKDPSGTRRIYWNPDHKAVVHVARGARHLQGVRGGVTRVKGGSRITVDYRPIYAFH
jgi:hypothetical protein